MPPASPKAPPAADRPPPASGRSRNSTAPANGRARPPHPDMTASGTSRPGPEPSRVAMMAAWISGPAMGRPVARLRGVAKVSACPRGAAEAASALPTTTTRPRMRDSGTGWSGSSTAA